MNKEEVRIRLEGLKDEKYKEFNEKLKPSKSRTIGVRMGEIRKIAKELSKGGFREYVLSLDESDFYEERLIAGMSIFYSKAEAEEKLKLTKKTVPFIDGWATCDSICSTMKLKEKEKPLFWDYVIECAYSGDEFRARYGLVTMLNVFIDDEHIDEILKIADSMKYVGYYDAMAAAWLIAECMARQEEKTFEFMKDNSLDVWVYNKAIQKMRGSYRISDERKYELKKMLR